MSSLRKLSDDLRRLRARIIEADRWAQEEVVKRVKAQLVARSSGPIKTKQLVAEDHPYATRHGSPRRDTSTINVQSGVFRSSWVIDRIQSPDGTWRVGVRNIAPYAVYLEHGTRTMFSRPVDAVAREYMSQIAPAIFASHMSAPVFAEKLRG